MFSASKTSGPSGYNLTNSLRFRASASAFLNRTPASTTNRQTWTWSGWVKRGTLGARQHIFVSANPVVNTGGQQEFQFCFDSSDRIEITGGTSGVGQDLNLTTTQVFRDPSAWYHFVVAIDTTQATSSNRMKFYVNGNQVTAFGTAIYPSQNYNTSVDLAGFSHRIGGSGGSYLDAYQDEINFIDGQALTPSSFGSFNATTGVWQPARYTGTYGTNGFYLNFTDIGLTSGSNTGLGRDFSGNGNFWNTNNISVTAGATYDAMTDVPTLTSATVANYAVMSPIDFVSANGTLSSGNLNWASSANVCGNRATIGSNSGKWYWEAVGSSVTSGTIGGRFGFTGGDTTAVEQDRFGMYWHPTSGIARIVNGVNTYVTSSFTYTNGDVLALALDLDSNISYWYKNGVLQFTFDFSSFSTIGSRIFFPYVWNASSGTPSWVYNFGQRPLAYTPPTGFLRLNTFNLPTSTIVKGNIYMDATLYTGTGAAQTITNAGGFSPDFVWVKNRARNDADPFYGVHLLFNTVTGVGNRLMSQSTATEAFSSQSLTAFNSNGFSIGTDVAIGNSGDPFVAWQWDAGSSTVTNTSGSISSQVRANTTAGFSIVLYTGNGGAMTVGHGLGVAPRMIILKDRDVARPWPVYHGSLATNQFLILNTTAAAGTSTSYWNNTAPTSTVFSVNGLEGNVGANGEKYVAYCFAAIAGYSAFGSYTGNANSNGTFVYTGFRPKFIMWKRSDAIENWGIWTPLANGNGIASSNNFMLFPNLANAQDTTQIFDTLSNGFKNRDSGSLANANGGTYIYAAFAENPFKNALAR